MKSRRTNKVVRVVVPAADAVHFDAAEVARILQTMSEREWKAVMQMVAMDMVQAVNRVSDPKVATAHGDMAHAAGGVDALGRLMARLQRARGKR